VKIYACLYRALVTLALAQIKLPDNIKNMHENQSAIRKEILKGFLLFPVYINKICIIYANTCNNVI
jgi:hypothetical protein